MNVIPVVNDTLVLGEESRVALSDFLKHVGKETPIRLAGTGRNRAVIPFRVHTGNGFLHLVGKPGSTVGISMLNGRIIEQFTIEE